MFIINQPQFPCLLNRFSISHQNQVNYSGSLLGNMIFLKRSFVSKAKFTPHDVVKYLQSPSVHTRKAKDMVLKLASSSTPITTQVHSFFVFQND